MPTHRRRRLRRALFPGAASAGKIERNRRGGGIRVGLHYLDYRPRAEEVAASIDSGEAPDRIAPIAALVGEALRAQGAFFADWYDALQEGRAFESQLTSELGYHEQLHRSKRALLEAWGRLVLLLPEGDPRRDAFLGSLCALDLGCGRRAR